MCILLIKILRVFTIIAVVALHLTRHYRALLVLRLELIS